MVNQFIERLKSSLEDETFVKLTLSKSGGADKSFKNVFVKKTLVKDVAQLQMVLRYATKDVTKIYDFDKGVSVIALWLGNDFLNADLFTTTGDLSLLFNKKRKARLFEKKASLEAAPTLSHDKEKKRWIDPKKAIYLKKMGITNANGEVLKAGQKKFKQINKYIEIIDSLVKNAKLTKSPRIVDMGAGKGYLTFALYDYLLGKGYAPRVTGIELRENLVAFGTDLAKECGYEGLDFVAQDINAFKVDDLDMLIALHACDIATDLAIAKGIRAQTQLIVVAPCCHKQIRKAMHLEGSTKALLKHGILEERQAEIVTDSIRSLLMESEGYSTKVFEFISSEHTGKNLMITGEKAQPKKQALETVAAIKQMYGIKEHFLESLL